MDFLNTDSKDTAEQKSLHEKVLLVGVSHPELPLSQAHELLEELQELVQNLKWEVLGSHVVNIREYRHEYLIGSGQADRVAEEAEILGATKIVFDHELSPAQQRHWEKKCGISVIDRQEVILDIFLERARTKEAVLQVELACMEYTLPRLKRAWTHLSRQRGGGSTQRGEGETQLELDQRMVRDRISKIKRELQEVMRHRSIQRHQRLRIPLPTAAIVGYTNAGKSSLMNYLTKSSVLAENKLFATLDPTTRRWELSSGQVLLLTDTVGFIRNLPHHLVEAFKATLEESLHADYLLHVLDGSNPSVWAHHETTEKVLKELGLGAKKIFLVINKMDLIEDPTTRVLLQQRFPEAFFISIKTGEGIRELIAAFDHILKENDPLHTLHIPFTEYSILHTLRKVGAVVREQATPNGCYVMAQVPKRLQERIEPYLYEGEWPEETSYS